MPKPVLAVDFDDMVCGFNEAYIPHHNRYYGSALEFEDAVTYNMLRLYGVTYDVLVERVKNFCHHHHHEIEPAAGVKQELPILSEQYDLQIVTSRCGALRVVVENWLTQHELDFFTELHFINSFGSLYRKKSGGKLAVCKRIGAIALLEDAPENAQEVARGGIPVLLPDKPWNQQVSTVGITRVHSWKSINLQLQYMREVA